MTTFSSTSDERTVNNSARQNYRVLSDDEKALVDEIKELSDRLIGLIERTPGRESSIAKTELQTATMWAVRGITA